MKKILIYGWFGENNYGDELLLKTITEMIKYYDKTIQVCVMCSRPKEVVNNHQDVFRASRTPTRSIKRIVKIILTDPITVMQNLNECEVLIVPGGGAISDWNMDSTKEMFYLINEFYRRKKKIFLLAMGAGPITKQKYGGYFYNVLDKATLITTRDEYSFKVLKELGLKRLKISCDIAFNAKLSNSYVSFRECNQAHKIGLVLAPVCMETKEVYNQFVLEIRKLLKKIEYKYDVSLIPFQVNYDLEMLNEIVKGTQNVRIRIPREIWDIEKIIAEQDVIIGMRYHSLILSVLLDKYLIPIIYHPKNASFCEQFNLMNYAESVGNGSNWIKSNIDADRMVNHINQITQDYNYKVKNRLVLQRIRDNSLESQIIRNIIAGLDNG